MTFKIGDTVVSERWGEGMVRNIIPGDKYPVIVRFSNEGISHTACYTITGFYWNKTAYDIRNIKLKEKKVSYFPCKIKVNSSLESQAVQEWLFEQGAEWPISGKCTTHIHEPFLYCHGYDLQMGSVVSNFEKCSYPELVFTITPAKVESVRLVAVEELVELNGKKYKKEDLETALKHIKPVGE